MLLIVVSHGWFIRQLDFNNAFLNGVLNEDVYMAQPPGYVDDKFPTHVCKLYKVIYGLKHVPRAWNNTLRSTLLAWGFHNSKSDTSLFIYRRGTTCLLLLVYVNDVVVTGNDESMINYLILSLDNQFALKDLGALSYFLGIQAFRLESGLLLTQTKYIDDLLFKLGLTDLKPTPTPFVVGSTLSLNDGQPMHYPFVYRSTIGALQYLTNTRPDIAFIINHLSQFL